MVPSAAHLKPILIFVLRSFTSSEDGDFRRRSTAAPRLAVLVPAVVGASGELGPRQRLGDAALEPGLAGQTCRITAGEQDCLTPVLPRDEVLAPLKLWEFGRCLSWDWDFNMVFVNAWNVEILLPRRICELCEDTRNK